MLAGWQEGHPACKKTNWWGAGMVMCLKRGVDLHMAKLMPLPLTVSCFSKIQIGFTFLLLVYPGSPRQRAIKSVCVCERERERVKDRYGNLRQTSHHKEVWFAGSLTWNSLPGNLHCINNNTLQT